MTSKVVITDIEQARARHQIALLGAETGGQLSFRAQEVTPGEGSPLHRHTEQAETFHVVHGSFRFRVGDEELFGQPGTTVHIPKGVPHAYLYEGQSENGFLISVLTPGVHDGFIQQIPEAHSQGASREELAVMAESYGATILGPGLTPTAFRPSAQSKPG